MKTDTIGRKRTSQVSRRQLRLGHWQPIALACVTLFAQGCAAHRPPSAQPPPAPTQREIRFVATAYCHGTTTAAGVGVRDGIVAADPHVLALGTVIRLKSAGPYNGTYTVLDTGARIQGRRLDVFIRDCGEAVRFGRREVRVSIIRHRQ